MNKICKRCGLEKSINSFAKNGSSTRVYCKECEAQRARDNYSKTQEYVRSLKVKCAKCGYDKNPAALEFHHPNGDKDALLCKNNNVHIHIDYIHPEVRKFLFSAKNVLIVEVNNSSIIREYNVPVNTEK